MAEDKRISTAAYCRVSTKRDMQDGSFEVQCAYYEKLIEEDPRLELVGIYGDHGKSGRYMRGRTELNRLIKTCEAGKVKLILTKSISRFARNMMECVETIRHLRKLQGPCRKSIRKGNHPDGERETARGAWIRGGDDSGV